MDVRDISKNIIDNTKADFNIVRYSIKKYSKYLNLGSLSRDKVEKIFEELDSRETIKESEFIKYYSSSLLDRKRLDEGLELEEFRKDEDVKNFFQKLRQERQMPIFIWLQKPDIKNNLPKEVETKIKTK